MRRADFLTTKNSFSPDCFQSGIMSGVSTSSAMQICGATSRAVGAGTVEHTPGTPSAYLSELIGGKIVLKAENLQRTGAFKIRGALNKLARLGTAARNGVVAGSAGNHAQALALAARQFGVPCEIFVPKGASLSKIAACRNCCCHRPLT